MGSTLDAVVDAVGSCAGLLVAVALIPQIYRTHQKRSAEDLSLSWQIILATGLTMQLSSLGHRRLWSVVFPLLGELVFILYLIALKFYFRAARQDSPEEATLERALCLNGNGHTQDNVSGTRKNIRDEQKEAPNDMKEQPEEGAVEADEENGWGRARRARSHNSDSASVGVWNRQGFAVRVDRAISSEDYTPPAVEAANRA